MPRAKVLLGKPELDKLAKGEAILIRFKEGTTELELAMSAIARGALNPTAKTEADRVDDFLNQIAPWAKR